jgi:hypothetical protein
MKDCLIGGTHCAPWWFRPLTARSSSSRAGPIPRRLIRSRARTSLPAATAETQRQPSRPTPSRPVARPIHTRNSPRRGSRRQRRRWPCVAAGLVVQVERGLLGHLPVRQAQRVCTQSRPIFYSLPRRRCYARHGVDRPASRHAGAALPASTSSSAQHGSTAMLKPMIDISPASLRCPPEALPGRPEAADTVAAA